ncbi:MAG: hypothetical protein SVN78_03330 [Deferribacterota bacterium]|nr:hypothetical protein [Deferribacterota bacterium]
MAKNKKKLDNYMLVDKIEKYISENITKIISIIAIVIILIFSIQIIKSIIKSRNEKIISKFGSYELLLANNLSESNIDEYIKFAKDKAYIRDYAYLKGAILYKNIGKKDKSVKLLKKDNDKYNELTKSLLFDLGVTTNTNKFIREGKLKSIWAYRNIISNNKISQKEIANYKENYGNSELGALLENWTNK